MLIMFIKLKVRAEKLFSKIKGDEDTIMGLPIKKIKRIFKYIMNEKIFSYWKSN